MRTYRRGNFAIYLSQEYCFHETDNPDIFELIDRKCQYEKLKEIGFLQYNKAISYKYVSKKRFQVPSTQQPLLNTWDLISL